MEVPMNGQQIRFTNVGNGDNTILLGTSFFNFLDNGISNNQSGLSGWPAFPYLMMTTIQLPAVLFRLWMF
jgi:hypothetical protein